MTTATDRQVQLQQRHGRDPLDAMAKFAQRQEAKNKGRPAGWGSVSADVFAICASVAARFPCVLPIARQRYNASTREIVLQQIDKWSGGADLILEKFNGNVDAALDAINTFRCIFDGGFTVAGPQSLVNSVGPGLADKSALRFKRHGNRREGHEPHSDEERAAAWERYASALERFIEERGTDENLWAAADEFAAFIGRDIGVAHAVLEARAVQASLAEEPLATGAEAIEAFFAED